MLSDEALRVIYAVTAAGMTVTIVSLAGAVVYILRLRVQYVLKSITLESEVRTLRTMLQMLTGVMVQNHTMTTGDADAMATNASDPLYQAMLEHFDRDGLELIAADIGTSLEAVRDGPLPNVALRLKSHAERNGKHKALIEAMQKARPGLLKELR